MAKVSNQDIYNQDDNLSMEDYLLGTNTNTINKKTQTYSLGSIFSLFYNFLGFNAFLFTTDTTTYPIGTPGCFFVFDEEDNLTNDFTESRKITFSATDTYNFNVAEYFGTVVNSGKFLFKLINLEDKNNFVFLSPSNFVLGGTGTTFNVDVLAESGLSNGSFVNYKRYLLVLEFAAGTFDPADYDLTDFTNTSGNPFITAQDLTDALDSKLDKSTTPSSVYTTDAGGLQVMKPLSEFSGVTSVTGDSVDNTNPLNPIINAIPLSGTTDGNPVSGQINFSDGVPILWDGDASISSNELSLNLLDRLIINARPLGKGISAIQDFTNNITDLDYTQKKYVDTKVPKVSTAGVERAYIINADGSQGTKATSDFKDVLEFANLAAFPVTGETGKIYLALDTNKTYRWTGSVYVQIGGINQDLYPIKYWYQATGVGIGTYGTNPLFAIGTQSDFIEVVSYRKYLTTTALGNLAVVREGSFSRINGNKGFHYEMRFKLENTASASDWRGLFGFRTTSAPTNVNPTDDIQPLLGIGADSGDTNLFFISKLLFGTIVKVDTGISKSTTNEFLLEIKRLKGTNTNELTLKNLSTGYMVTTVFDNGGITTITNYVSNNTSAKAIGFSIQRIRLNISE